MLESYPSLTDIPYTIIGLESSWLAQLYYYVLKIMLHFFIRVHKSEKNFEYGGYVFCEIDVPSSKLVQKIISIVVCDLSLILDSKSSPSWNLPSESQHAVLPIHTKSGHFSYSIQALRVVTVPAQTVKNKILYVLLHTISIFLAQRDYVSVDFAPAQFQVCMSIIIFLYRLILISN